MRSRFGFSGCDGSDFRKRADEERLSANARAEVFFGARDDERFLDERGREREKSYWELEIVLGRGDEVNAKRKMG